MRLGRLLRWDLRFQARYGFYLLYGFLTTFYTLILFALLFSHQFPFSKKLANLQIIVSLPIAIFIFAYWGRWRRWPPAVPQISVPTDVSRTCRAAFRLVLHAIA